MQCVFNKCPIINLRGGHHSTETNKVELFSGNVSGLYKFCFILTSEREQRANVIVFIAQFIGVNCAMQYIQILA